MESLAADGTLRICMEPPQPDLHEVILQGSVVDVEEHIPLRDDEAYAIVALLLGGSYSLVIRHPGMAVFLVRSDCRAMSRDWLFRSFSLDHGILPAHPYLLWFQFLQIITPFAKHP